MQWNLFSGERQKEPSDWKDSVIKSDLMLSVSRLTQMHFTICINWRTPLFLFSLFKPCLQINYRLLSSSPPAAALGCLSPRNFGTCGRTKVLCAAPTARTSHHIFLTRVIHPHFFQAQLSECHFPLGSEKNTAGINQYWGCKVILFWLVLVKSCWAHNFAKTLLLK